MAWQLLRGDQRPAGRTTREAPGAGPALLRPGPGVVAPTLPRDAQRRARNADASRAQSVRAAQSGVWGPEGVCGACAPPWPQAPGVGVCVGGVSISDSSSGRVLTGAPAWLLSATPGRASSQRHIQQKMLWFTLLTLALATGHRLSWGPSGEGVALET